MPRERKIKSTVKILGPAWIQTQKLLNTSHADPLTIHHHSLWHGYSQFTAQDKACMAVELGPLVWLTVPEAVVVDSERICHTCLGSGGQLSYTTSVELVAGWTIHGTSLFILNFLVICGLCHAHTRKGHQVLPSFPHCKQRKAGQVCLGTRLVIRWTICLL